MSGKVLKYYTVTRAELRGGRVVEAEMQYVDALQPAESSRIRLYDIVPLKSVPEQFFTKEYLESGRLFPFDF